MLCQNSLGRSFADVFFEPGEHFLVPQQRVVRFHDPVILVGKIDEPRGHAFLSERVEVGEALRDGHAKVFFAVQDEGRGLEVGGEALGGLFVDDRKIAPGGAPRARNRPRMMSEASMACQS